MILIVGATGSIGREVVRLLAERGLPFRALSRDVQRSRSLPGWQDVEVIAGDPADPASLTAAFQGVDQVVLIPPSGPTWNASEKNLIDAAKHAGVKYVVKISTVGVNPDAPSMSQSFHAQGESLLAQSGIPHTILRPNSFMQNFVVFYAQGIRKDGVVYQCTGNVPTAMIDTRDIAAIVVRLLTEEGHAGKTYELSGPEAIDYTQAAQKIGAAIGRDIRYMDLPPEVMEQAMIGAGLPAWGAAEVVNIYGRGFFREGGGAVVTAVTAELLGRPPRSFDDFARDYADHFRP